MGMIDAETPMSPLLEQVEAKVAATVKPEMKEAYNRIIAAGMKFAFDPQAHGALMRGLDKSKDPVHDVAIGAVGVLLMLYKKSKNTMPMPAMVPAGMVLVLHGLDYLEQTGRTKITNAEVDTATQLFITNLQPKIGLTDDVMKQATEKAHGAMQDPTLMAKFQQSQGGGPNGQPQ